jgi:hypothetical protein
MLWAIFVILLFLWLSGVVIGYTMGGVVYILLVIAILVLGVDIFRDERYRSDLELPRRRGGIRKEGCQQVQKDFSESCNSLRDNRNES